MFYNVLSAIPVEDRASEIDLDNGAFESQRPLGHIGEQRRIFSVFTQVHLKIVNS